MSSTSSRVEDQATRTFKRRFMARLFIVMAGGTFMDGYILGVIGPVTDYLTREEMHLDATGQGLMAAMALLGILIGSPLGGWATDKWGRKPIFMLDITLFAVVSLAQFFVPSDSPHLLFVIRFLMGVAIGAEYSVSWPMMSEFAPPRMRGRLMAINQLAFYGGFMVAYALAFFLTPHPEVAGQQQLSVIPFQWILGSSTIIAVLLMLGRIGLPESARWLWSKGRKDEARAVVSKFMVDGDAEIEDLEREQVNAQGRFKDLFSRKNIRSTVFVTWLWFCNVLPYFGISTFAAGVLARYGLGDGLASGVGLSMVSVIGVAFTMFVVDRAGRRVLTVPPQWIMLAIFLVLGFLSLNFFGAPPAWLILALFMGFSFLIAVVGVMIVVYPSEVYPTDIRGVGTGFSAAVSRIGAATGTFLLPIAIKVIDIGPTLLILSVVVASGAIVSQLWAPETKGKRLSETSAGAGH